MGETLLSDRIANIKLVIVDNDGVMTDGRIIYGDYGDELKFFDVQDGFGITLLKRAGIKIVMISGKKSRINKRRAKELQFDEIFQNAFDKLKVYEKMLKKYKLAAGEVCYVGDDLIDIPPMKRVGLAVAVHNAVPDVKSIAHVVTERSGGRGAVREVVDLILKSQGKWAQVTEKYFR